MIVKWLRHGTGDVERAVEYLMNTFNHKKEKRERVTLLRGDPTLLAELGKEMKRMGKKWIYSSAVISFHPEDNIDEKVLQEILDEFERCMCAYTGVDPSRLCYVAVFHQENNNRHIHVVVLRMDLETGKSVNPAPPGWERLYGLFRRYMELKYGLVNADERRRPVTVLPEHVDRTEWFKDREKVKEEITNYVLTKLRHYISLGQKVGRDTVIEILKELGELNRVGRDYISVRLGEHTFRLKGGIYDENAGEYIQKLVGEVEAGAGKSREISRRELEEIQRTYFSELRRIYEKVRRKFKEADGEFFLEFGGTDTGATKEGDGRKLNRIGERDLEAGKGFERSGKRSGSRNLEVYEKRANEGRADFTIPYSLVIRCNNRSGVASGLEVGFEIG